MTPIHDSLETAAYWQYKTVSNFTLTADQSGCQVTVELSRKVYKEDQYVFVENQVQDGPVCYYWALCRGRTNNDQTDCPYQTP
jgi:hypothetical protein